MAEKVTRFRKRRSINIGFIVFLIIFIYVLSVVYIYLTKDHLSIYEVKEGFTADNNIFNGLIIRDEEVVNSDVAGYINYYHRDGDRVAKNTTIYTVDKSKKSYDLIGNGENLLTVSNENTMDIKKEILNFQKDYNNSNFSTVYNLKYELDNKVLEIANDNSLNNLHTIMKENGTSNSLKVNNSKSSGIISYSIDNMEGITAESATVENFNLDTYNKIQLRTMELVEKNSPIYRIIKSEDWNIILLLDENQYKKLHEKEQIKITFTDTEISTIVPISTYQNGANYFAKLNLTKYLDQYINDRYISIELETNSAKGLKIPMSAVIKKDFYTIPLEFFTLGGDSGNTGLMKESYNTDNGEAEYVFVPADIYYKTDKLGYIDGRLFENPGVYIRSESGERYQVGPKESLEGVFNVNKGYAIFRRIEILYKNEEYCIVKDGTEYGLSVYDHIALDGKTAVEQAIIY